MSEDPLVTFLRARLDEDEAVARDLPPRWFVGERGWVLDAEEIDPHAEDEQHDSIAQAMVTPAAAHIARHDPARVLAEVAAKRAILRLHVPEVPSWCPRCDSWPCSTLKALALPYAGHPDCREEWRP